MGNCFRPKLNEIPKQFYKIIHTNSNVEILYFLKKESCMNCSQNLWNNKKTSSYFWLTIRNSIKSNVLGFQSNCVISMLV